MYYMFQAKRELRETVANVPRPSAEAKHEQQSKTEDQPQAQQAQAKVVALNQNVVQAPPTNVGDRTIPPKGTVPFKVQKGLVIAFGDQLIGRPTRNDFPDQGFIPMPQFKSWSTREIAYSVHPDLPRPERVQNVMNYLNSMTSVRFVPLENHPDSIVFAPSEVPLCLSYVGKVGGHQPIFLDDRCEEKEILHEVLHALGFIHEHSRPDRDNYVQVAWDRIDPEFATQFEMIPEGVKGPHVDRPFDYTSIMIYEPTAFAKDRGEATLLAPAGQTISPPQSMQLSEEDLERIERLFHGKTGP